MTWRAFEMDAKREGRVEGRAEGRAKGRVEGRAEGISMGMDKARLIDIGRMLKNGKTIEQIVDFCGYGRAEVQAVSDKLMLPV